MRKNKLNFKRLFIIIFLILFIILISFLIYFSFYYKADNSSNKYLKSSDSVKVIYKNNMYIFDGKGKDTVIVFYPGAKVDTKSYSKLMYKLAEGGIDCFLLDLPFRFAFFSTNKADDVLNNYKYKNYYLGGHSLGGVVASMYTYNNSNKVNGLILLGSYSTYKINNNIDAYSIYGSNDLVLNKDEYNSNKSNLPSNYNELVIDGGNHSGFALYGEQKGDGKSIISKNKQINITSKYLIDNIIGG